MISRLAVFVMLLVTAAYGQPQEWDIWPPTTVRPPSIRPPLISDQAQPIQSDDRPQPTDSNAEVSPPSTEQPLLMKSSFGMAPQMSHYSCYNATVCGRYCWSQWFDRDNPSGTGDWETLADIAQQYPWSCARRPVLVECQSTDGIPFYQTGNRVIFNSVDGCICRNIDNFPRRCRDYRIRVLCPC